MNPGGGSGPVTRRGLVLLVLLLVVRTPGNLRASTPQATGAQKGSLTQLPIDPDLLGAWWRPPGGQQPAEAIHYTPTGHYLRVTEDGQVEKGLWVALVRKRLRWLRRCPGSGGSSVSPGDCSYFGRYLLRRADPSQAELPTEMVEEEVCPEALDRALTGKADFEQARQGCAAVTVRFQDEADEAALLAKAQEAAALAPPPPPAPPPVSAAPVLPPEPAVPDTVTGGTPEDMVGIWVGHLGAGPERVTLIFHAAEGGRFTYTLEAGGQEETSEGEWSVDNKLLVLHHPDGEVERIPFSIEGNSLRWSDEDLGSLVLERGR